jgi:hypothetical protein
MDLQMVADSISDELTEIVLFTQTFQPHFGPGVDSASNRNEYQDDS